MNTKYSFKVVTSAVNLSEYQLGMTTTINVFSEHFGSSHLSIGIKFSKNAENYQIEAFEFKNNGFIKIWMSI